MIRSAAILLLLLAPATAAGPAEPSAGADGATVSGSPRAVIETPEIDAGVVARGEAVTATFEIRNAGDAELAILSAKPG